MATRTSPTTSVGSFGFCKVCGCMLTFTGDENVLCTRCRKDETISADGVRPEDTAHGKAVER